MITDSRSVTLRRLLAIPALALALLWMGSPAAALETEPRSDRGVEAKPASEVLGPYVLAADELVLEDKQEGYDGQYVFAMSKSLMRSTLVPALKPLVLLLTVPLDLVTLPFAAVAGFF